MIRKHFDNLKRGFHPIIDLMQLKTEEDRHAVIKSILSRKKFPLKELLETLQSSYMIADIKEKTVLIDVVLEILVQSRQHNIAQGLLSVFRNTVDPAVRKAVLKALVSLQDQTLLPSIIPLIRSPKRKFRQAGFELLDTFPPQEVSRAIVADMNKSEWHTFEDVLNYVHKIDPLSVLELCRIALEKGNESDKSQALRILAQIGRPEAIRIMEYAIGDASLQIRMQVAKAFADAGGPASLQNLIRLTRDEKADVVLSALDGLFKLKTPAAVSAVVECIRHKNTKVRIQALKTLGEIGTADEVEHLINGLKDKDIRIRQVALEALLSLTSKAGKDIVKVIKTLMSHTDVNVRRAAAQILGQVDAPGLFDNLFNFLRDEDWWVRETVAENLARLSDERIFPAAVSLLDKNDASLRRYAIEILEGIGDERCLEYLIRLLKDPDWWVRERAISALGKIQVDDVVPILAKLLNVRELAYAAAEALGNIGSPSAIPALMEHLDTAEVEAKIVIMTALEKLQAKEAVPLLERLLSNPVKEVRNHTKEVLTRLRVDSEKLDRITSQWWKHHDFSLMDMMLLETRYRNGSDLFLVSSEPPMARIKGELVTLANEKLTGEQILTMVSQILSPDQEQQFSKTSDLDFSYEIKGEGRFRGNLFRHTSGINLVFRLLPDKVPELSELGLPEFVQNLAGIRNGLVLVTGPASCGKSTTLAAVLNEINKKRNEHIITIEDPIEYVHTPQNCLITQREVGRHSISFARALRAALREDPDIIMVGELRDLETISMALTAAETGHYVLSTLHSISASKTVDRIVDVFPARQQGQIRAMLAESLKVILAQQLIPLKDEKGHAIAMEILVNTPAIAMLIRENKLHQIPDMILSGHQYGMMTMDQSLMNLLQDGIISPEEAFARATDKNQFESFLKDF